VQELLLLFVSISFMPAVSVLPLVNPTLNSPHSVPDPHIIETMPAPKGAPDVDSAPTPGTEQEGSKTADVKSGDPGAAPEQSKNGPKAGKKADSEKKEGSSPGGTASPSQSSTSYPQALPAHSQQPGYYVAYQSQVTPEPPSPGGPGATTVYDVGSFLQQPTAFHNSPFAAHQYSVNQAAQQQQHQQQQQPPHSPSQNSMGGIPPASPLFPRVTGQATAGLLDQHRMLDGSVQQPGEPLSPGPPYLSSQLGHSAMYQNMGVYHNGTSNNHSPEEFSGWGDNR
jgi:hypothetical protein